MLELRDISKSFAAVRVCDQINLRINAGECRVILGPNGAGKTTLFQLLSGNIFPDSGKILLNNQDITNFSVAKRCRQGIGRSYQINQLFDQFTVAENLAIATASKHGSTWQWWRNDHDQQLIQHEITRMADQLCIADILDTIVNDLAYGYRRMLEIAMALMNKPQVLLLDEPTAGVDPEMTMVFYQFLMQLPQDLAVVVIEHDLDLAFRIAQNMTVLHQGKVVFDGDPALARQDVLVQEIYLGTRHA